ncbi:MAG: alkaline phosphatase [Alphaproteobacteria bacterium]|nr:alkaline phosphatase [Alphaproteobacteria bacterium]
MRYLVFFICFLTCYTAFSQNIILMIGDGMGKNHLSCVHEKHPLFLKKLTPKGEIKTYSADNKITDSAASATAYSCGIKTNNGFLGLTPFKEKCETLAETALLKKYQVFIRTTDVITGATPSAFYAHQKSRHNTKNILKDLEKAKTKMNIEAVQDIESETKKLLSSLETTQQHFFIMIEESEIDKQSHLNNFDKMSQALVRFDKAVETAINFAKKRADTTVIIVADHETGGLTSHCKYTKLKHTGSNVFYYVEGKQPLSSYSKEIENTDIHFMIKNILLP